VDIQSNIPGLAGLVKAIAGIPNALKNGLGVATHNWYWDASRIIGGDGRGNEINEFPFFTFLYADLHAHLIAMPLTFVSLAAALAVVRAARGTERKGWRELGPTLGLLLLWALAIGAMRTTNTWDLPPHLLLALGALVIAEFSRPPAAQGKRRRFPWRGVWAVAWKFGLVAALSWLVLYWPFWESYGSFYNSVALWTGTRTRLWAYLIVHGLFLFAIVSYLIARVFGRSSDLRPDPWYHRLRLTFRYWTERHRLREAARLIGVRGLPVGPLFWLVLGLFLLLEALLLVPGLIPFTRTSLEALEAGGYAYRGLSVVAFGLPIAVLGFLLLFRPALSPTERLWSYLVLLGLAMSLGVEVIVLQGDIGRMNTVFKFYLQVWWMWGVCAAAALAWMVPRLRHWRFGRGLWIGVLAVLLLFAALYPPLATWAKVRDRFDATLGPGLDGWEYMTTARYDDINDTQYDLKWDLEAMQWLLDNVVGSPVILEGHAPEYRWGARYANNTGLPTVLGWNWHQRQQRAAADDQEVWLRADDIARMYNDPIPALMEPLLDKYHVRYIIVGPLERTYYEPTGLKKFDQMVDEGTLQVAFRNDRVTIYEVVQDR